MPSSTDRVRLDRRYEAVRDDPHVDRLERVLRESAPFLRRRDLLAAGVDDAAIRRALAARRIFRVRHGWYSVPEAAEVAVRAIRVGGRVTGLEALRLAGLILPPRATVDLVVPANAAGLRSPHDRRARLGADPAVRVHWLDRPRNETSPRDWLVSDAEALAVVLRSESREVAIAACDGLIRYRGWSRARLRHVFAGAPERVRPWLALVDGRAESWGETFVRLRLVDAGIPWESQSRVPGAGRFDGRVASRVYIEVDGSQHLEGWSAPDEDWFERDRVKDAIVASLGGRVLRITYPMFRDEWGLVLDAVRRAIAEDEASLRGRGIVA